MISPPLPPPRRTMSEIERDVSQGRRPKHRPFPPPFPLVIPLVIPQVAHSPLELDSKSVSSRISLRRLELVGALARVVVVSISSTCRGPREARL